MVICEFYAYKSGLEQHLYDFLEKWQYTAVMNANSIFQDPL